MAENEGPPIPPGSLDPLVLTPLTRRSQQAAERAAVPPEIEEQFNQLMQNVQVLTAHFLGDTAAPTAAETLKERTARRVKKFHRASGDERTAALTPSDESALETSSDEPGETAATDEPIDPLARNRHIAWPRQIPPGHGTTDETGARPWWQRRSTLGLWIGAQAIGLLLLAAGYLLGRTTAPAQARSGGKGSGHTAVDLFGQPELTEQAFQTANDALHAEHAGDPEAARKIYETALAKHVNLTGMNYRLALLAVQRNDRLDTEQRLERSTLGGEDVADCCYVLARLAADKGDLEETANQLQRAVHAQPFDGKYLFYYGEALRRGGKPQAAITAFEQALDRPYTAENGDLYLFKERLAKVEYGHDDAFNAELAGRLKQTPVAGEWLLLAAAQDLDRQAYAAAAEYLRLAAERLPAFIYATLTHDYVFQSQVKRPELTSLLNRTASPAISSAGPTVLDPGAWSPERGDPATWPSASTSTP